jgi:glycosyltransferase involved in cell wall biosynthesis
MNIPFAKRDEYGIRSYYICTQRSDAEITVFTPGNLSSNSLSSHISISLVKPSLYYQLLRYAWALLRKKDQKRKAVWKGFDVSLARAVEKEAKGFDIVHTWEWIPETIQVLKRKNPKVKIIRDVVVNRFNEYYSGTPITEENKLVDYFFSPSAFSTERLISWGIPPSKIFEIPFGVDCDLYKPHEKKESPVRFCFSGGVSRRKGVDSLLRVWKRLNLKDAELHLYGTIREDVKEDLEGARNVVCHGFVPLSDELPKNHVYVFPSTLEGSAKSVYEALACGLPVITTPDSGSIVRDGIEGYIVPPGDDDSLYTAMKDLYENEWKRVEFGENARKRALEYTWDRYARTVWDAYKKSLGFNE